MLSHNDDKLDSEADKEEKVELQQRNVDLEKVSYLAVNIVENPRILDKSDIASSFEGLR